MALLVLIQYPAALMHWTYGMYILGGIPAILSYAIIHLELNGDYMDCPDLILF